MSRISGKLKGLSLDRLETLSQVLAGGGISRAAGGDANRQSQFSRQIAELEGWFGVELMDRSVSPSRPTAEAARIVREVDQFLRELEWIRAQAAVGRRTVVFGAGERMIRNYLVPWAARHRSDSVRLVFRNLTSSGVRAELNAGRIDVGILRVERCPAGFGTHPLKPIPMCLLLPEALAASRKTWKWKDLAGVPLVLMEGGGSFHRFAAERSAAAGVDLDAAVLCSSWSQIAECMGLCHCGGFLPRDMERAFPTGLRRVALADLADYQDHFAVAWSQPDPGKRPELHRTLTQLGVPSTLLRV